MKPRTLLILGAILALLFIWQSKQRNSVAVGGSGALPQLEFASEPQQTSTNAANFDVLGFHIKPIANFALHARILSRENYSRDTEAQLAPIDLALGWHRMAEPAIYQSLTISQSNRWYRYSWSSEPPIPPNEIIVSSANMHMIPANPAVLAVLEQAQSGKTIRLSGYLVEIKHDNGWQWRSSTSRSDSGGGACEVVYVQAAEVL